MIRLNYSVNKKNKRHEYLFIINRRLYSYCICFCHSGNGTPVQVRKQKGEKIMSYHFTASVTRDLEKLSKSLPSVSTGKRKRVHRMGKFILASSTETTISGKPIDPDKLYTCYESIYVDHYRKLKNAFRLYGWEGVKKYCDAIYKLEASQMRKQVNKRKYYIIMAAGAISVILIIYLLSEYYFK